MAKVELTERQRLFIEAEEATTAADVLHSALHSRVHRVEGLTLEMVTAAKDECWDKWERWRERVRLEAREEIENGRSPR